MDITEVAIPRLEAVEDPCCPYHAAEALLPYLERALDGLPEGVDHAETPVCLTASMFRVLVTASRIFVDYSKSAEDAAGELEMRANQVASLIDETKGMDIGQIKDEYIPRILEDFAKLARCIANSDEVPPKKDIH